PPSAFRSRDSERYYRGVWRKYDHLRDSPPLDSFPQVSKLLKGFSGEMRRLTEFSENFIQGITHPSAVGLIYASICIPKTIGFRLYPCRPLTTIQWIPILGSFSQMHPCQLQRR